MSDYFKQAFQQGNADSSSTKERGEQPLQQVEPEAEEANGLLTEAKALGVEVATPMATGIAASPLLALGPKGWVAYGLVQAFSGGGSNVLAQTIRDPDKEISKGEAGAAAMFSMIPGLAPAKTAKLGKLGTVGVRAAEGAVMAGGEETTRQAFEIAEGRRETMSPFEIGFATVIGSSIGGGLGRLESSSMINRMGVSSSDAKKIQSLMEAEVASRINKIDRMLKKHPELNDGEMGAQLRKEKEDLTQQLTEVSRTDREYLQGLQQKAQEEKAKLEKQFNELALRAQGEPKVGEGTVLRAEGDAPDVDTFNFKKAIADEDAEIARANKPEMGQLTDLVKHIGIEGDVKTVDDIRKLLQDPANKDKLIKFLQDNPIEVSHNKALKDATGESYYEIKDGNHRYELAELAGIDDIPVSKKSADEIGIKAPEAPAPEKPSKLTDEQKLEAINRMDMSDEDLSAFIEGKTQILPINIGTITNDTDLQRSIAAVTEQVKAGFKKSGVKTDKESLLKRAQELRSQLNPDVDPVKYSKDIAKKSEDIIFETVVADSLMLSAFQNWNSKIGGDLDFNDPKTLNDLMADLDRLGEFVDHSSTISSSAGKLLQSRKVSRDQIAAVISDMEKQTAKAEKEITSDLIKYSKDLKPEELQKQLEKLGGLKAIRGFTNELRLVRDNGKLGRLLEITRKSGIRKFADMYMELRYDMILSAPTTQGAAAMGNALMSLYSLSNQAIGGMFTKGGLKQSKHAIRTAKNLMASMPDAFKAAKLAAKNSKGQMALNSHYEKVGGKAFSMEETGITGAVGETVENLGELMSFGPKGLVFQDEFYRHMFAKAQVKSLLTEEYNQLIRRGEAPVGKLDEYIEGKMSRYFVDGKRFKTKNDINMEAVAQAREQNLEGDEAVEFVQKYVKDNWTEKLSSEMEYMKDFGDRVTFQQELSKDYNWFERMGSRVQDERNDNLFVQYLVPFIKTPVNIFKEFGGTTSQIAELPFVGKLWARTREELQSDNPMVRAQARGRQITGGALWLSAIYLADQQIITGSGPRDYKELQNKKNAGWMPNSINTSALKRFHETGDSGGDQPGDNYVSLQRADPLATITGFAADMRRAREDNDFSEHDITYLAQVTAFSLARAVGQKSYLETVGSALEALTSGRAAADDADYGEAFLEELIRGNTPAILNAAGRSEDPYIREVNGPIEMLRNRLGSMSQTLNPRRDAFGQKVKSSGGSIVKRELNAVLPTTLSSTGVEVKATQSDVNSGLAKKVGELIRKEDKATQIILEIPGRYSFPPADKKIPGIDLNEMKVPGTNQSLYDRWQEIYSQSSVKEDVIEAYENPDVKQFTRPTSGSTLKDLQKQTINNVMQAHREAAFAQLLEEYPELYEQYEYQGELQLKQLGGEQIPKEMVAPGLRELINN